MDQTQILNYIALNQNVFKKGMVFGNGPVEGKECVPSMTNHGYSLFINGIHQMPKNHPVLEFESIGTLFYPDLLPGMPSLGAEIVYNLATTELEYLLIAQLKLDEAVNGPSEYAEDWAVLIFKDRVPFDESEHKENIGTIMGELLFAHLTVFIGDEKPEEIISEIEFKENETFLKSVFDYYLQHYQEICGAIKKEISPEEKSIIDEMNNMKGEND